ncbi:hypothetical protein KJ742_04510 [Patescibacteria group bacterium]|nr:hypothetical protein [Patescibacteria group bacterium]MBU1683181.1 hypothetical protein [Patescibacteria group bacterium]MBU1934739.1 hypothetical protein [Patescibacteria group bacterium]
MQLEEKFPGIDFEVHPDTHDLDFKDFDRWNPLERADFYMLVWKAAHKNGYTKTQTAENLLDLDGSTLREFELICTLFPPEAKEALAIGSYSRTLLRNLFSRNGVSKEVLDSLPAKLREAVKEYRASMDNIKKGISLQPETDGRGARYKGEKRTSPPPKPKEKEPVQALSIEQAREIFDKKESTKEEKFAAFMALHPVDRAKLCSEESAKHGQSKKINDIRAGKYLGIIRTLAHRYRCEYERIENHPEIIKELETELNPGDSHESLFRAIKAKTAIAKTREPGGNGILAVISSISQLSEADGDLGDLKDLFQRIQQGRSQ